MNICTIATEDWLEKHLVRWARCVRKSNPDCKLYLFLVSDNASLLNHEFFKDFEKVKRYPKAIQDRTWFNRIRMSACGEFGVNETLYCDCDADILEDLSGIPSISNKDLMWVKSPKVHGQWVEFCGFKGIDGSFEANNGFLYMRRDFKAEYEEAEKEVWAMNPDPRVAGTFVFNWMIRKNPAMSAEMPYENSVIWWDVCHLATAKCIQYCSDMGQQKRILLEQVYRTGIV